MSQATIPTLRRYFELGADLANQQDIVQTISQKIPLITSRTVELRIVRPRGEVARYIPDWLRLYSAGRLKPGAVEEEAFSLYIDPQSLKLGVVDSWQINKPTITIYLEEWACWSIASRRETVYTAYIKGFPMRIVGDYVIRDLELVDEILETFYTFMRQKGYNLVSLFEELVR